MIFIDTNIVVYRVGQAHPLKDRTESVLRALVDRNERLVTSAGVFQEILHRYRAAGRADAVQQGFDVLESLVDEVYPVEFADVQRAKEVLLGQWTFEARDALHVAVMKRHRVRRILTFDTSFDGIPGLERIF